MDSAVGIFNNEALDYEPKGFWVQNTVSWRSDGVGILERDALTPDMLIRDVPLSG